MSENRRKKAWPTLESIFLLAQHRYTSQYSRQDLKDFKSLLTNRLFTNLATPRKLLKFDLQA